MTSLIFQRFDICKYLYLSKISFMNTRFPVPLLAIQSHIITTHHSYVNFAFPFCSFGFTHNSIHQCQVLNLLSSENMISQKELPLSIYFFANFSLYQISIYRINILSCNSAVKIMFCSKRFRHKYSG